MASRDPTRYDPKAWSETAEEEAALHIGLAILRWQRLETALFLLFHTLSGAEYKITSACYFHLQAADSRVSLISKIAEAALSEAELNTWNKINKKILNLRKLRNAIAHYELVSFDALHPDMIRHTNFPIALNPHHLNLYAKQKGKEPVVFLEALAKAPHSFSRAAEELLEFCVSLPAWKQQSGSLPQALVQSLEGREIGRQGRNHKQAQ